MGSKTKDAESQINPMKFLSRFLLSRSVRSVLMKREWDCDTTFPAKCLRREEGDRKGEKLRDFLLKKSGSIASSIKNGIKIYFHNLFSSKIRERWGKKRMDHDKSIKAAKEKGVKS